MGITERAIKFYLLLIVVVLLLSPHAIRMLSKNSTIAGDRPYYNLRLSEYILDSQKKSNDDLMASPRPLFFNPYHYLLAGAGILVSLRAASILLPILLGIASVFLFYSILGQMGLGTMKKFLISLLLILSPPFIFTFVFSDYHALAIFLTLLGFFFFLKEKRVFLVLSIMSFVAASLFSVFNILAIILLSLFFSIYSKKSQKPFLAVLFFVLLTYFVHPTYFFYTFQPELQQNAIAGVLSDLGGMTGFSVFSIALVFFGFFLLWKDKKKYYPLYLILLASFLSYLYVGANENIYSNFIVAVFAGFGFLGIVRLKWQFDIIKQLTVLIIICGLFFSVISYTGRISNSQPSDAIIESLDWLKQNSNPGEVVFSHYSTGHWIEYAAERPVLLDSSFVGTRKLNSKIIDSGYLFNSMDLEGSKGIIRKYNISYIWLNSDMKGELVWKNEETGLLFLLRNNETFKNIYSKNGIEIWKVINQSKSK